MCTSYAYLINSIPLVSIRIVYINRRVFLMEWIKWFTLLSIDLPRSFLEWVKHFKCELCKQALTGNTSHSHAKNDTRTFKKQREPTDRTIEWRREQTIHSIIQQNWAKTHRMKKEIGWSKKVLSKRSVIVVYSRVFSLSNHRLPPLYSLAPSLDFMSIQLMNHFFLRSRR